MISITAISAPLTLGVGTPSPANMRVCRCILGIGCSLLLAGCVFERSSEANDARAVLVGKTENQISECMGPPEQKSALPSAQQWTYFSHESTKLSCRVDLFINGGQVTEVRYSGHAGGLFSENEQCAPIVGKCVPNTPGLTSRVMKSLSF